MQDRLASALYGILLFNDYAKGRAMPARENLKQLSAWVHPTTKTEFVTLAKANDHTESSMLKLLINAFLKKNPSLETTPTESIATDAKLTFWLGSREKKSIEDLAQQRGLKPSPYMRGLVRAHISNRPSFSDQELVALKEANRQLAAIGKNINQIARALNTSLDNAHLARAQELDQIRELVDNHRKAVANMVRENLKSWSIGDGS